MSSSAWFVFVCLVLAAADSDSKSSESAAKKEELLLLTVATNSTDGFQRYLRSARINDLNGKVLGMGEKWLGGDMNFAGGGFKVNLLKAELDKMAADEEVNTDNLVVMFTDSYDVVLTGSAEEILLTFRTEFDDGTMIVFGAEGFCWPRQDLEGDYPEVSSGYRFLNSGGFIGEFSAVRDMIASKTLKDDDDDQLFYTDIFLNKESRRKWGIVLDNKAKIFQNLNGALGDVSLKFRDSVPFLANTKYDSEPLVIHGNGPAKVVLNSLGNYLPAAWNKEDGCTACWEDNLDLDKLAEVPQVVLAVFVEQPTPFLQEFLAKVSALSYPKSKMDLFVHSATEYHDDDIGQFLEEANGENKVEKYNSVTYIKASEGIVERAARTKGIQKCVDTKCDYYLSVDSDAHLDNEHVLRLLIEQNRAVVAPVLVRPFKAWSNFWGALTQEGFYARSTDYMDIVQNNRRGLWNVPFVSSCYLVSGSLIRDPETRPSFSSRMLDPDMAVMSDLRSKGVFVHASNRLDWGHLVDADDFVVADRTNPELWELERNRLDWEARYLHVNYSSSLEEDAEIPQPCPDVFWFPAVSDRFADELVEVMERHGKWSDGSNNDARLEGGYENVPTIDIHMNQVGFEREWLKFLDVYVRPLQEKVFTGYIHSDSRIEGGYEAVPTRDIHLKQVGLEETWLEFLRLFVKPLVEGVFIGYNSDPPRAIMNFVVRYRPDEQPLLRPHHDASTYTINIALNNAGVDYQGGGCNFLRYDCAVPDTKKGWMLMHPGRLTHYHEGLETTRGTRYIMISFVDP